jgi:uncharacterized protein (TIGR02246 family)
MNSRSIGLMTIASMIFSAVTYGAQEQNTEPRSVIQRFNDAQNAGEVDAALAMWAEDGVRTNSRGAKMAGKAEIRKFIQGVVAAKIGVETESMDVVGDRVTWTIRESSELYRKLDVAPVRVIVELLVRDGKITSWLSYIPPSEISKLEQACAAQPKGVLPNGQPCGQFIEPLKAHTTRVIGAGPEKR